MADATEEFFGRLAEREYEPLLASARGSAFFDIRGDAGSQQWVVRISNGKIAVSREPGEADFAVRADRAVFNRVAGGEVNALSAVFRGLLTVEGDARLLVMFQRLFPPPPRAAGQPEHEQISPAGGDEAATAEGAVRMLDGASFVVCDGNGDIEASPADPTGLFSYDTRFLSRWILTINGQRLSQLSLDDLNYFENRFFLVPGAGTVYVDVKLSVIRHRWVCDGVCEDLVILNHDEAPVDLTIRVDAASDFAHIFEVKNASTKRGRLYTRVEPGHRCSGTNGRPSAVRQSSPAGHRPSSTSTG
jgi:hypothetical protein